MYRFLETYLPRPLANVVIALWYFLLIVINIYCGISAAQGTFQYVGW